jgi:hypothetical protein
MNVAALDPHQFTLERMYISLPALVEPKPTRRDRAEAL